MSGTIYNNLNQPIMSKLFQILWFISLTYLLLGCSTGSLNNYENPKWNFGMEYKDNWELNDDTRVANDFSLQATENLPQRSSARIQLIAETPTREDAFAELGVAMENYLKVISQRTHQIKSLQIIQVSDVIDNGNYKMISATVSVPTLDIVEGSNVNQMGQRDKNISQIIDIYILQNRQGQNIIVEVYKGTNEELNSEADEIVQSIYFIDK